MSDEKREKVKLTGLWERSDKNGNIFYTGKMGTADLVMFKNTRKQSSNSPDWTLFVTAPRPKNESGGGSNDSQF